MRPLRLLIAHEDRDTKMTLGILLRSEGAEVRLAAGAQVPQSVAEFEPDAVLLDMEKSAHGGADVARELRQRYGERCPVLITVARPYDPEALLRLVSSLPRHAPL